MPTPFGPTPDFKPGSRVRDALNADFLQAVKDNAERCSRTNVGSFGVEGLTLPEYEPDTPLIYARIIGAGFNTTTGATEYSANLIEPQDTIGTGLMFMDTTVDTASLGLPIVSMNPDIPIDGSVVIPIAPGQVGSQFLAGYPQRSEIFVQVLAFNATSRHISYQEITHDSNGSFSFKSGGYAGNETINWAIEPNNQTVSVGDRGFIRRGYCPGAARVKVDMLAAGDLPTATHCEQNITIQNAQAGNFTLSLSNQTTAAIPYNTNASVLQGQLNNLTLAPSTTVTGTTPGPFNIVFGDYTAWGPLRADITHLRTKQEWLFSKTTGGNTSINITANGSIRWAYADSPDPSETGSDGWYWSGQLVAISGTTIIDEDQIWLRIMNPNQKPSWQIPLLVRSEDDTYEISGETNPIRPLYTFHPNFEITEAEATSNAAPDDYFDWKGITGGGNATLNGTISGTILGGTGAINILRAPVLIGDKGFVIRDVLTSGRPQVVTTLTTTADGVSVSQVETISNFPVTFTGTFSLLAGGSSTSGIAVTASVATMQTALDSLLGGGAVTVSGTTGGPWVVTWNDFATHELIRGNADGISGWTQKFVFFPSMPRTFTGNVSFENMTVNSTLNFNNTVIGGNISISPNNTTYPVAFVPGDFVGWGEVTASNLSVAGWVYSWQRARPADINSFYHLGGGGTINNGTLWERNNFNIPIGEHVRIYYGERTNGTISVTNISTYVWHAITIAGGGTFTLAANNGTTTSTTGNIAFGANATTVKTAFDALAVISSADVTGTGTQDDPYVIEVEGADTIATITGNGTNLTYNQNYVCEYEETGAASAPASPNLSIQFNSTGAFSGSANLTFNTTSQKLRTGILPTYKLVATNGDKELSNVTLGGNMTFNTSTMTVDAISGYGNGTSSGGEGDIQFAAATAGDFDHENGGPTHVLQYNKTSHTLRVYSIQLDSTNAFNVGWLWADATGQIYATNQGSPVADATGLGDIVAQFNALKAEFETMGIIDT